MSSPPCSSWAVQIASPVIAALFMVELTLALMGRAAQGVRILNIERPDMLIGIDSVAKEDDGEQMLEERTAGTVSIAGELDLDGSDEVVDPGLVEDSDPDVSGEERAETEEQGDGADE